MSMYDDPEWNAIIDEKRRALQAKYEGRVTNDWYPKASGSGTLFHTGPGWWKLQEDLIETLFSLGWNGVVHQTKEKFGGLRFYIGHGSTEMHECITAAEALSYKTCEKCGEPGTLRTGGWLKTLCDEHSEGRRTHEHVDDDEP